MNTEPESEAGRSLESAQIEGDDRDIQLAIMRATFDEPNTEWIYNRCLELMANSSWQVAAAAATCIGQLARLRSYSRDDTEELLRSLAASDVRVRPFAEDALDDFLFSLE